MNSLVFPTTADKSLITSSFPKRTTPFPVANLDLTIHFDNQPRLVTVELNDESAMTGWPSLQAIWKCWKTFPAWSGYH
ncbi:MAG: hypothetical protein FJZ86_16255 [Chloroflexi bacterium]|nr:hypothetical protein [Chloroflexota bacterium]